MTRATTTTQMIDLPALAGGRPQARALARELPQDLSRASIVVDFRGVEISTESFVDELVQEVLVRRHAAEMSIINVDGVTATWFDAAADEHNVASRLKVDRQG